MLERWHEGETIDVCDQTKRAIIEFIDQCFLGTGDSSGAVTLGEQLEDVYTWMLSAPVHVPLDLPVVLTLAANQKYSAVLGAAAAAPVHKRGGSRRFDWPRSVRVRERVSARVQLYHLLCQDHRLGIAVSLTPVLSGLPNVEGPKN